MSTRALVALVGSPNCGKTALFNLLTGARQKVANYAGVTVERKEGMFVAPSGRHFRVLDLPGAYSLAAKSADEAITRDICLGAHGGEARPDVLACVVDATNLRLHLRFALELRQLGQPMVLVLNMVDTAIRRGIRIDSERLAAELGMPVVETVAVRRGGAQALVQVLDGTAFLTPELRPPLSGEALHGEVARLLAAAVHMPHRTAPLDDAIDRLVLHPVLGLLLLAAVLFLVFQAVFSWAQPLMDGIEAGINAINAFVVAGLPEGSLRSLLTDGIIAGAGSVLVFLPQIVILFFFILVLEDSGYLPRAAFLLDRFMVGAGLSGRAFIPLLSSFACAVPGIMATRTIPDMRDRLTTILIAPLMTCSARLPVYTLLIGAFIPEHSVAGVFNLRGVVLFALYLAGVISGMAVAFVLNHLRRDQTPHALMLELPAYRLPNLRNLVLGLWERVRIFLRRVGTIILALMVLLWFLSSFPAPPPGASEPAVVYSLAGRLGEGLEAIFAPVGFNWQICIALVPGLAAREVAVGALATVYALAGGGNDLAAEQLLPIIAAQWSMATAYALLAWYVFAPQCLSTLSIIKRETNSWRTMWLATAYLMVLAYAAAFVTYRIASTLS